MTNIIEYSTMPFDTTTSFGKYVSNLIITTGDLVVDFQKSDVSAAKVREVLKKIKDPIAQGRTLGVCSTVCSLLLYKSTPLISTIFFITGAVSGLLAYDLHQTYTQLKTMDEWLIGKQDFDWDGNCKSEKVTWEETIQKIRVTCDRVINSTLIVGVLISSDLRVVSHCLTRYKEKKVIEYFKSSVLLRMIQYFALNRSSFQFPNK